MMCYRLGMGEGEGLTRRGLMHAVAGAALTVGGVAGADAKQHPDLNLKKRPEGLDALNELRGFELNDAIRKRAQELIGELAALFKERNKLSNSKSESLPEPEAVERCIEGYLDYFADTSAIAGGRRTDALDAYALKMALKQIGLQPPVLAQVYDEIDSACDMHLSQAAIDSGTNERRRVPAKDTMGDGERT